MSSVASSIGSSNFHDLIESYHGRAKRGEEQGEGWTVY